MKKVDPSSFYFFTTSLILKCLFYSPKIRSKLKNLGDVASLHEISLNYFGSEPLMYTRTNALRRTFASFSASTKNLQVFEFGVAHGWLSYYFVEKGNLRKY